MIYDVIIIGGGASGFATAITAYRRGKKVLLLEKEEKVASKIMMTGNGKCNLSACDVCKEKYNHPDFVAPILEKYDLISFLSSVGIFTKETSGRIYPYSETAKTVVNMLRAHFPEENVVTNCYVDKIEKQGEAFTVCGYQAKNVVLCTGSNATKGTPSYALLEPFSHKTTNLIPALTPIKTDMEYIKGLAGIRTKVKIKVLKDGKEVYLQTGELLFKEDGISGICTMAVSQYMARHPDKKYELSIDFLPDIRDEEIEKMLAIGGVESFLPKVVARAVEIFASKNKTTIVTTLHNFVLTSPKTGSSKNAQVMCGGLDIKDFNNTTLESKLCKGLYAGGEVLDIDGECGGYNLHWAFVSGMAIGNGI